MKKRNLYIITVAMMSALVFSSNTVKLETNAQKNVKVVDSNQLGIQLGEVPKEIQLSEIIEVEDVGTVEESEKRSTFDLYNNIVVTKNGDLYHWEDNEKSEKQQAVKLLSGVKSVCEGTFYYMVILENGDLYCWGDKV